MLSIGASTRSWNAGGQVALEATDDLALRSAFGGAARDVFDGGLVMAHPDDDGSVQRSVGLVSASIEAMPSGDHARIDLVTEEKVHGIDAAEFQRIAGEAKAGCPVSRSLAAVEITLDATLAG
jgi:hypothetical protein